MEAPDITSVLDGAERSIDAGRGLGGTGFWPAVSRVKRTPALVEEFAERIAVVDQKAFSQWAWIRVPIGLGTALAFLATAAGLVAIGLAYYVEGLPAVALFYGGTVALLATTHGFGHLLVGSLFGIRFTHWFVGSVVRPQPGVKIDYASYLRTPPTRRAWMHASGALATKSVPFALIGAAAAANLPVWAVWGLAGFGVATIATDVAWSTKSSDWKKFRREMRIAQS